MLGAHIWTQGSTLMNWKCVCIGYARNVEMCVCVCERERERERETETGMRDAYRSSKTWDCFGA